MAPTTDHDERRRVLLISLKNRSGRLRDQYEECPRWRLWRRRLIYSQWAAWAQALQMAQTCLGPLVRMKSEDQ